MCSAHVNQRSSKNCIIPLGVGAARGDYSGLGFLTQTWCTELHTQNYSLSPRASSPRQRALDRHFLLKKLKQLINLKPKINKY